MADWAEATLRQTDGRSEVLSQNKNLEVLLGRCEKDLTLRAGLYQKMRLGGRQFDRGLNVQANSVLRVPLNGRYDRFEARIGVDDWAGTNGGVRFTVAGPRTAALITSGDVLLRFARELPPFPEVDVLGLGMRVAPEKAKDFGVFFVPRQRPGELAFFLQKPSPQRIHELAADHLALVDTGTWLFSERAVRVLMERCGWQWDNQAFAGGRPAG